MSSFSNNQSIQTFRLYDENNNVEALYPGDNTHFELRQTTLTDSEWIDRASRNVNSLPLRKATSKMENGMRNVGLLTDDEVLMAKQTCLMSSASEKTIKDNSLCK